MPRGQSDFGIYTQTEAPAGIADPGEAAARLGSINVYDRRGWTVWMDDFEAPVLKWGASFAVGGKKPILESGIFFRGVQCVYFNTPIGEDNRSFIFRNFPLLRRGRVGVELWVCGYTYDPGYLSMLVRVSDGVNQTDGEWRLCTDTSTLSIVSGGIAIPIATDVYAKPASFLFAPIKLVIDMDTDYYTRLLVGPDEYDISKYPLDVFGGPTSKYLRIMVILVGSDANIMTSYADCFILTQNEP